MKKFWLHGLALSLGLVGSAHTFGQYPNTPNSMGASSYPVQQMYSVVESLPQAPPSTVGQVPVGYGYAPQNAYAAANSYVAPQNNYNVPQGNYANYAVPQGNYAVPQASPYQLVAGQDQATYGQQIQPQTPPQYAVPSPTQPPTAPPAAGCQSCNPSAPSAYDYGYQQMVAPNCTSYAAAPTTSYSCAPAAHHGHLAGLAGLPTGAKPWFFGGGALFFNRIDGKNYPLSFQDSAYAPDVLGTQDAQMGVMPGFEVMMGRYFNCGRNAIAVSYWGIFSDDEEALRARTTGGDYRSRIPFTYVDILDPTLAGPYGAPTRGVYDWFDAAYTHTLQRSSEYHNLEVNLLGFAAGGAARNFNQATCGTMFSGTRQGRNTGCGYCGGSGCGACGGGSCDNSCGGSCGSCAPSKYATGPCCLIAPSCGSRMNVSWLAGFRYFRFEDNLTYAASLNDSVINRGTDDLYYDVNTTNDLVGFQLGSRLDYCLGQRINLYGSAKAGIYSNYSTLYTRIATDYQTAYLNDTRTPLNPNQGQAYIFNESKTDVAFLGELGTGLGLRLSPKWTATVGYRAVFASGVATSPGNLQYSFANYADVRDYNNYDTLILHGINIGALYNF